jgi:hypothetical protein
MTITATRNPRHEITVRVNECWNPNFGFGSTVGWSYLWFGAGGAGTNSLSSGAITKTWTTAPSSNQAAGFRYRHNSWGAGLTKYISGGFFVQGASPTGRVAATFYDAAGTSLGVQNGTTTPLTAGFTVQVSGFFTAPAGTDHVDIDFELVGGTLMAPGTGISLDSVLILQGNAAGTYFDGDTYAGGFGSQRTVWEGTHGNSRSLLLDWDPADVLTPDVVEGWDQSRPGRNTFYDLLDGTTAIVQQVSAARRGTLKMMFSDRRRP